MFDKQMVDRVANSTRERILSQRVAARFTLNRDFYIPKGVKPETPRGTDMVLYKWQDEGGKLLAMGFVGKQNKPLFNYMFRDENQRENFLKKEIDSRKLTLERKEQVRDEKKSYRHDLVVGDILYTSWGYDQTNVDFYEVIGTTAKSVVIREVGQKVAKSDAYAEYVVPVPGRYIGSKMNKRVGNGGYVRIESYSSASKWDGKPKYKTPFGMGH